MPSHNLDYERTGYAIRKILEERFPDIISPGQSFKDVTLKQYRSVVLGAAPYLRQCGLLQLAAFYLAKDAAEKAVLTDVLEWLHGTFTGATMAAGPGPNGRPAVPREAQTAVMLSLRQRTSGELALLEREANEILGVLKRVAEGLYKEAKAREDRANDEKAEADS